MSSLSSIILDLTTDYSELMVSNEIRESIVQNLYKKDPAFGVNGIHYEGAKLNNGELELVKSALNCVLDRFKRLGDKDRINSSLCFVFKDDVSSFAYTDYYRIDEIEYDLIVIYTGLIKNTMSLSKKIFENDAVEEWKPDPQKAVSLFSLMFIIFHETAHRMNGHQGMFRENLSDDGFKKMIEWDADSFAATQLTFECLDSLFFDSRLDEETFKNLFFSFAISFMKTNNKKSIDKEIESVEYHTSLHRFVNCVEVCKEVMIQRCEYNELCESLLGGSNVKFDRNDRKKIEEKVECLIKKYTNYVSEKLQSVDFFKNYFCISNLEEQMLAAYKDHKEAIAKYDQFHDLLKEYSRFDIAKKSVVD
ncbi:hypothetical protein OL233_08160 [Vagococcus sp. PNs007]|uniref:Uncharacterized protein n=1 Tax=Vagococcus proximus TaxID=2991417 RepID=A0ABT5X2P9_9ENTE|nr:hypothetical protein [Vagococcus proximus]MDF0480255.1 hypothetical protein [Vagococcus proximus]